MGNWSRTRAVILILAGALAVAAHLARAQYNPPLPTLPPTGGTLGDTERHRFPDDQPSGNREIQERQMKRIRQEHQQELINDTARLVQLATALKAEVDQGTESAPQTDALKQADEINKLAKKVSERIKTQ